MSIREHPPRNSPLAGTKWDSRLNADETARHCRLVNMMGVNEKHLRESHGCTTATCPDQTQGHHLARHQDEGDAL